MLEKGGIEIIFKEARTNGVANAVGSVCVGEVGATKAVKSMGQILKFIETGKLINYDKC